MNIKTTNEKDLIMDFDKQSSLFVPTKKHKWKKFLIRVSISDWERIKMKSIKDGYAGYNAWIRNLIRKGLR